MQTARKILPQAKNPVDTITLDETARHRRRMKHRSDHGIEFLLDLPAARLLLHGQGIELDDGRVIEIVAEAEPLYEVHARDPHHLLQLCWQLGNRHLATQIVGDRLRIRRDHVIRDMLIGLGAGVSEITASFNPEGGAYSHEPHGLHHHGHFHD